MEHQFLLRDRQNIAVVGAGGTGSQVLTGIARMCVALNSLGLNAPNVTVYDPDTVSSANIGRQLFAASDIGQYKAEALVQRFNAYFGLSWEAHNGIFKKLPYDTGMVVSCVDKRSARKTIREVIAGSAIYWLDTGNMAHEGQVILGNADYAQSSPQRRRKYTLLPTVADLFPEIVDDTLPEDDTPSCSLAEALEKQDLLVNQAVATQAVEILWQLYRYGVIAHHGVFLDVRRFSLNPLPVDPILWKRYLTKAKKYHKKMAA